MWHQTSLLDHVADRASQRDRVPLGRTSIAHDDPSGRGFDQRVDHLEESRLTRAAGAQERQDLAPGHTEADSLDCLMAVGINLRDVIPDHGFRSRGRQLRHEPWFPLESRSRAPGPQRRRNTDSMLASCPAMHKADERWTDHQGRGPWCAQECRLEDQSPAPDPRCRVMTGLSAGRATGCIIPVINRLRRAENVSHGKACEANGPALDKFSRPGHAGYDRDQESLMQCVFPR